MTTRMPIHGSCSGRSRAWLAASVPRTLGSPLMRSRRPSTSARLRPTLAGVSGAGTHVAGSAAVRISISVEATAVFGPVDVAYIRQGENGHQ